MAVEWSKRGDLIAACCGSSVSIWEPFSESNSKGKLHEEVDKSGINCVQWSPNRRAIVFGSVRGAIHTSSNGQSFPSSLQPFGSGIQGIQFSSDGRQIFAQSAASIHQLDLKRQEIDHVFTDGESNISSFCLTDDFLVTGRMDGSVNIRSFKQGISLGCIWPAAPGSEGSKPLAIHSSEQLLVASSCQTGSIRLATLSSSTGFILSNTQVLGNEFKVTGIQFLGQGNFINTLAATTSDGKLLLYDLRAPPQPSSILQAQSASSKWSLSCLDFKKGSGEIMAVGSTNGRLGMFDLRSSGFKLLGSFPSLGVKGGSSPVTQIHWQPPSASSLAGSRRSSLAIPAPAPAPVPAPAPAPVPAPVSVPVPISQAIQPQQEPPVIKLAEPKRVVKPLSNPLQDSTNIMKSPLQSPSDAHVKDKEKPGSNQGVNKIQTIAPDSKGQSETVQLREEIRNLHIDLLKQSHYNSEEMRDLLTQVLQGQKRIEERMDRIEERVEMRRGPPR